MSTSGSILLGVAALIGLVASAYLVAVTIMAFAAKLMGDRE
jgi:hypothetical protein